MAHYPSFFIKDTQISEQEKIARRRQLVLDISGTKPTAMAVLPFPEEIVGVRNCENLIGSVALPLGIAGPLDIRLTEINDKNESTRSETILLPLATTEGALIASVNRGAHIFQAAGGMKIWVEQKGMTRAPVFYCGSYKMARAFCNWLSAHQHTFRFACKKTSTHLRYLSHHSWIQGRLVYVRVSFDTDEAMGMNMVSIALDYWWHHCKRRFVDVLKDIRMVALSSNMCTDKKAAKINQLLGRGFQVHAEAVVSATLLQSIGRVSVAQLLEVHRAKNLVGSALAGSMAQNMHVANSSAAFFIATGQDPAHTVDVSMANVTLEQEKNDLYIALDIPTLPVGSVGGGSYLPQQQEVQQCISMHKPITARLLAATAAAAALCGELSGLAALAEQTLAQAHKKHARNNK